MVSVDWCDWYISSHSTVWQFPLTSVAGASAFTALCGITVSTDWCDWYISSHGTVWYYSFHWLVWLVHQLPRHCVALWFPLTGVTGTSAPTALCGIMVSTDWCDWYISSCGTVWHYSFHWLVWLVHQLPHHLMALQFPLTGVTGTSAPTALCGITVSTDWCDWYMSSHGTVWYYSFHWLVWLVHQLPRHCVVLQFPLTGVTGTSAPTALCGIMVSVDWCDWCISSHGTVWHYSFHWSVYISLYGLQKLVPKCWHKVSCSLSVSLNHFHAHS